MYCESAVSKFHFSINKVEKTCRGVSAGQKEKSTPGLY